MLHLQVGRRFLTFLGAALVIKRTVTFGSRRGNECEMDFGGVISHGDPTSIPKSPIPNRSKTKGAGDAEGAGQEAGTVTLGG